MNYLNRYIHDWHADCFILLVFYKRRNIDAGSETVMKQESIDYLDKVACIANANMAFHQMTPVNERDDNEAGAALLMSAYLEMYEHWQNAEPGKEAPSNRVFIAADACVRMRNLLLEKARSEWPEEEEGLFQMMSAFMFLFKHMYVPQY